LRLLRPDSCCICGIELAAGQAALWDRERRVVICPACHPEKAAPTAEPTSVRRSGDEVAPTAAMLPGDLSDLGAPFDPGLAGASAQRQYDRRKAAREQRNRQKLGRLGVALTRITDEPQSTRAWHQGARGELRAAAQLEKRLAGTGVRLLHDRRIPGHGAANIDHLAIGRGGITVIDTKTITGKIRTERVGGLFSPRRTILLIDGRDRTTLIDSVEAQITAVKTALDRLALDPIDVRGALCFPYTDGLPLLSHPTVRDITIDAPGHVAKLASRSGTLTPQTTERICTQLARILPTA
jgi:hypothetical protein